MAAMWKSHPQLFEEFLKKLNSTVTSKMGIPEDKFLNPPSEAQMNESLYKQVARNILKYLSQFYYEPRKTASIVRGMSNEGCPYTGDWHKLVRDVLNRLAELGKITKLEISDKKHTWKIKVPLTPDVVDENDPFGNMGMKFTKAPPINKPKKQNPIAPYSYPIAPYSSPATADDEDNDKNDVDEDETSDADAMTYSSPCKPQSYPKANGQLDNEINLLKRRVKDLEDSSLEDGKKIEALQKAVKGVKEELDAKPKKIEIHIHKNKIIELKGKVVPKQYETILKLAQCRRNVLLVGPAGCGKSYLAKLVADSLGLDFGSISCTAGMSESHFTGRSIPNLTTGKNTFQSTSFLDCYENGGVYLLDELDAADPNLLLVINTALANGYCNLPNRTAKPKAMKHDDFIPIATANTFGKGGNRQYVGRSQLDESTLDRFRIGTVECDYDPGVERHLCPNGDLLEKCWEIRKKIVDSGLRRVMSTRFIQDAYIMNSQAKWDIEKIVNVFLEGWTPEEKNKVLSV